MPATPLDTLLSALGLAFELPEGGTDHQHGRIYDAGNGIAYCSPDDDRACGIVSNLDDETPTVSVMLITDADGPAIGTVDGNPLPDGRTRTEMCFHLGPKTAAALVMMMGAHLMRAPEAVVSQTQQFLGELSADAGETTAAIRYLAMQEPCESARGLALSLLGCAQDEDEVPTPQDLFDFEQVAYVVRDLLPAHAARSLRHHVERWPEWAPIVEHFDHLATAADLARARAGIASAASADVRDFYVLIQQVLAGDAPGGAPESIEVEAP